MEQESNTNLFRDLELDNTAKQYISTMATWARVIVIVTLVGYVASVVELISPRQIASGMERFKNLGLGFGGANIIGSVISIGVGLIICYFLIRFSSQSRKALYTSDQQLLNESFASLKNYFLILSILIIVMYVFALLAVSLLAISR